MLEYWKSNIICRQLSARVFTSFYSYSWLINLPCLGRHLNGGSPLLSHFYLWLRIETFNKRLSSNREWVHDANNLSSPWEPCQVPDWSFRVQQRLQNSHPENSLSLLWEAKWITFFLRRNDIFVSHPTQCNYCQSNHYQWYTEWQVSKQQIFQRSSGCGNESVGWLSELHTMASLMARNTVCRKEEENNGCEYATQRTNWKSENFEGILRKDHRSYHGEVHN